ncbi:methyl-accepting chemotaxis protein [Vibrio palustris]|uniref:Methyl-accepting chemotaxis protein McpS n=1 Tax=Vibrio palustris TaxID=1918946 RepID=A0A1R4B559_9VIBR|nr:methyl-accepting chemotaxis protein [Vibrio palustris]SJL84062.1 Methyl-accepting chemotaxis protein McpS [Vibrio palustris]
MIRNINIGIRTALLFGIIGIITIILGVFASSQLSKLNDTTDVLTQHRMPAIMTVADMASAILLMQVRINTISDAKDTQTVESLIKQVDDISSRYDVSEKRMEAYSNTTESKKLYDEVRLLNDKMMETLPTLFALSRDNKMEESIKYRNQTVMPAAIELRKTLDKYMAFQKERADDDNNKATVSFEESKMALTIGIVITLALMGVMGIFYTKSLTVPLNRSVEIAKTIASGDLTEKFKDDGKDEAAQMIKALADMQAQLRNALSLISDSSQQLAATSEELSAVTSQSSQYITQQSDEVNYAATAVSELTTAIDEVARSANSARDNSEVVDEKSQQGKIKIAETIKTVDLLKNEIGDSEQGVVSLAKEIQNIGKVLSVIREIADQTNLLALNAAIEAARAGENGRGFAVVADEVRALAHRTQTSTTDIEDMMSTVSSQTDKAVQSMSKSNTMAGTTLGKAREAGESFEEISVLVSGINDQNATIASAAEEQATVAQSVDKNITHIRDLSVQTSAGSDQTTASSKELAKLAEHLHQLVKRFKL